MIGYIDTSKVDSFALAVNGTAIFTRAKVKLYGLWPDYVFGNNYDLLPVPDLEKYVSQNKHLPGMPSSEDVTKNGIDLGNTQAALLKKVEELTLYIIDQNKKTDEQDKKIIEQDKRIAVLEAEYHHLETLQEQVDELKSIVQKMTK